MQIKNTLHGILFYAIVPFVGIVYFLNDNFKKKQKVNHHNEPQIFHTYTPDNIPDFNSWMHFIHNSRK